MFRKARFDHLFVSLAKRVINVQPAASIQFDDTIQNLSALLAAERRQFLQDLCEAHDKT